MIEALGATVAPFVMREKPQLFPRLATSFIKNVRCVSGLRTVNATRGIERPEHGKGRRPRGCARFHWLIAAIRRSEAVQVVRAN
jgi:hypothetical protein